MNRAALRIVAFLVAAYVPAAVITGFQPIFLADRGLTPASIGTVLALATFARMLAMPAWGWVADLVARRGRLLSAACGLAALAALSWLPARGEAALLATAVALGLCVCALMPLSDAIALGAARAGWLDYGRVRAMGSLAYMIALAATGWIVGALGSEVLPWLLALPYVAGALLAPGLPEAARTAATPRASGMADLFRRPAFLLVLGSSALIQGSHGALYGLASLHWRRHGIPDGVIGLLWAEGLVSEVLLFLFAGAVARRIGPPALVALASCIAILRWSVTASTTALPALVAVQVLHGATYGLTHLAAMLILSRHLPPERAAAAQTLHAAIGVTLPTGIATWLAAQSYDGSGRVFWAMATLAAPAMLVAWGMARRLEGARPA